MTCEIHKWQKYTGKSIPVSFISNKEFFSKPYWGIIGVSGLLSGTLCGHLKPDECGCNPTHYIPILVRTDFTPYRTVDCSVCKWKSFKDREPNIGDKILVYDQVYYPITYTHYAVDEIGPIREDCINDKSVWIKIPELIIEDEI